MLFRCVIEYQVEDDANTACVRLLQEDIEICQRAVLGCNAGVIGDVIAAIGLRRWEVRREPDGVHAKSVQIVESGGHTREIADAVTVAIGEAARRDLIEDARLPPFESRSWSHLGPSVFKSD